MEALSNGIDPRIVAFIRRHHVMTLATVSVEGSYCANLFYAWDVARCCFVVTSDPSTRHGGEALKDGRVSGSVVLETRIVGKVQGLQWRGRMMRVKAHEMVQVRKTYLKRFPYAAVADLDLWVIVPEWMKYTDNTLGFGKKLLWQRAIENMGGEEICD